MERVVSRVSKFLSSQPVKKPVLQAFCQIGNISVELSGLFEGVVYVFVAGQAALDVS